MARSLLPAALLGAPLLFVLLLIIPSMATYFFFLDPVTSLLVGEVWGNFWYWITLAAGVAYAVYYKLKHRADFSTGELAAQFLLVYAVATIGFVHAVLDAHDIRDQYAMPTTVKEARLEEGYRWRTRNGSGRVEPRAEMEGVSGGSRSISLADYAALKQRCGAERVIGDGRENQESTGDGRVLLLECRRANLPTVALYHARNFVKGAGLSIISQTAVDDADAAHAAEALNLPRAYPFADLTETDPINPPRIFDAAGRFGAEATAAASERLSLAAAEASGLGFTPFNPLLVIVDGDVDATTATAALSHVWRAPRRYDLWVMVNLGEARARWVKATALTDDAEVLAAVEDALAAVSEPTPDKLAAALAAATVVNGKPALRFHHPDDYAYLASSFTPTPVGLLLTIVASWAASWAGVKAFVRFSLGAAADRATAPLRRALGGLLAPKGGDKAAGPAAGQAAERRAGRLIRYAAAAGVVFLLYAVVGWRPLIEIPNCDVGAMDPAALIGRFQQDAQALMMSMEMCAGGASGVTLGGMWTTIGDYRVGLAISHQSVFSFAPLAYPLLALGAAVSAALLAPRRRREKR